MCVLQIVAKFSAAMPDSDLVSILEYCLCELPNDSSTLTLALPLADAMAGVKSSAACQKLACNALLRVALR